ncbi:lytic polysaccharide monooxygenase auxiliary activity family 9 protein [Promicromonospora sp. NPDC050880]|uniref:lytic polysaccharide monooxygenase auxiliary activity family 9 protein n=1 Tax=unclassified Promicromonospora TaxID=2647929 RepID=UPI0037A1BC42
MNRARTASPPSRLLLSALAALALAAAFLVAAPGALLPQAQAHGWITNPPSRADHCATGTVSFDCGGLQYEPQSVEAPKGSMECSGGSGFTVVDDDSLAWPRTTVGSEVTFRWQITARHSTSTWEYFVDGQPFKTVDDGGAQPGATVEHTLSGLPAGDHTVFARWNIADTVNAFYQCVDITVGGAAAAGPVAPQGLPGILAAPGVRSAV